MLNKPHHKKSIQLLYSITSKCCVLKNVFAAPVYCTEILPKLAIFFIQYGALGIFFFPSSLPQGTSFEMDLLAKITPAPQPIT